MTNQKIRLVLEQAIQDLGAPRMTYAPSVEIKELRNIVRRVSRTLLTALKEINRENKNQSQAADDQLKPQ